jgi:hypothetical protein
MRNTGPLPVAALRCASGANCVSYATLGEPSKLSRGNPGPWCFACELRRGASEVEAVAAKLEVKAAKHRQVKRTSRSEGHEPEISNRAKRFNEQQTTDRAGTAIVGHQHAEEKVSRASAILERRRASMLTCKRLLQSAIVSEDARLVRIWSRSLGAAESRLLLAEADFEACEKRA